MQRTILSTKKTNFKKSIAYKETLITETNTHKKTTQTQTHYTHKRTTQIHTQTLYTH